MRLQLNLNSSNTNTVYDGWFELVFESLRNSTDAEENKYLDFFFFFFFFCVKFSYFIMKLYVVCTH